MVATEGTPFSAVIEWMKSYRQFVYIFNYRFQSVCLSEFYLMVLEDRAFRGRCILFQVIPVECN